MSTGRYDLDSSQGLLDARLDVLAMTEASDRRDGTSYEVLIAGTTAADRELMLLAAVRLADLLARLLAESRQQDTQSVLRATRKLFLGKADDSA